MMLRRRFYFQREKNQKLSPRFVRGQAMRQRPPGTATQNSRFGGVTRARPLVLSFPNTKGFSKGFMAFWNSRAARLHAACPHGWPRTDNFTRHAANHVRQEKTKLAV
jgi:hypothetical protein